MQGYFGLDDEQLRRTIVDAVQTVTSALRARGVDYAALRSALTPQAGRREVALFFDTLQIDSGWYGNDVQRRLLPLLAPTGAHSVMLGDLLGADDHQPWIEAQLRGNLEPDHRPIRFRHSTQFFCVYLNNCSAEMVRTLHDGLLPYEPYLGFADVTYASVFKTYLSTCLTHGYLKWRRTIIQQHGDDLPEDANQNTMGYPFEGFGLNCRSIGSMYFGLLLSYKIERPVFPGFEQDQLHSLNAISSRPSDIANLEIEIEDRKYDYLCREKTGTLQRLGILGQPKATLHELIRAKLQSNYLYNMRFREDYSVSTFNILLELQAIDTGQRVRTVASFVYEPNRNVLRLVTFY
jgi:hypothetical protein